MARPLYLEDSYLRECDSIVQSVTDGQSVILDRTIFYPRGGGQPSDTGRMVVSGSVFRVLNVTKSEGRITHELDQPASFRPGDSVHCVLDWERRHRLMRMHTGGHVLSAIIHTATGARITGNSLEPDESRIDFNLEDFDREKINEYVQKANDALARDLPITIQTMPYAEAMGIPGMVKLAEALPPNLPTLRVVQIGDVDLQADGGLHVKSTREVGQIEVTRAENKGKSNRRIYFRLV